MKSACYALITLIALIGLAPTGHAQAQEELARRQYESGLRFLGQQRYDDALKDLRGVVEAYPASAVADDALLRIAEYQLDVAENVPAAQSAAEQLLQKYPLSDAAPGGLIMAGRVILASSRTPKDLSNALAQFERVAQLYPKSLSVPESLFWEGETQRLNNQPADALLRLGQVIADYPGSPWAGRALLSAALCDIEQDQPYAAIDALQRLRLRFPRTPEADRALAWNTQIYRLYVRAPGDAPYVFTGRSLTGSGPKLKDIVALSSDRTDSLFAASDSTVIGFTADGGVKRAPDSVQPRGVLQDQRGRLVILQKGGFRPATGPLVPLATIKPDGSPRGIEEPAAATVLSTGELIVSDPSTRAILRFSPQGKLLGTFANERPVRLATNDLDEIAALIKDDKRVVVYGRDGKVLRTLGPRTESYEFRNPVDIAYDALGHLLVLDRGHASVLVFSRSGKLRANVTFAEKAPGNFRDATALTLDSSGRLFIYSEGTERIQIYQ